MKPICLVLVLALSGCSFFMTRGPSDTGNPPRAYPSCTSSMTYPIVDGVFTALFLTSMATAIADNDETDPTDSEASRGSRITTAAILAGLTGVSAYVGYSRVSKCRAAHESFATAYPNGTMPYGAYPYYPAAYPQQGYYAPPTQSYPPPAVPQQTPQQVPPPYPAAPPTTTPPTAAPAPGTTPAAAALGTEGDVCTATTECATGLTCSQNVCIRPSPSRKQ